MADAAKSLKVFVSYSRTDVEFADQLVLALEDKGFQTILDRHDMSGGENWRERLGKLILSADAVTFILSEKSAASEICAWEVDEAKRLSKRILPVTPASVASVKPPQALSDLNWIPFYADPAVPGSGFYYGVKRLEEALRVDLDWLRSQTRYLERSSEWTKSGRAEDLLLRGEALREAHAWLGRTPAGSSPPDGVREYLSASADAEQKREAAARLQIEEREKAVKLAEAAVTEKQEAVAAKARTDRSLRVLAMSALVAGIALVAIAGVGLWYASKNFVDSAERDAKLFAREANTLSARGDKVLAMLVALSGDPAAKRGLLEQLFRPGGYPAAREALARAYATNRLVMSVPTGDPITAMAAFADDKRFITFHKGGVARVWEVGNPAPARTVKLPIDVMHASVLKDGERVLALPDDGRLQLIRLADGSTLQTFTGDSGEATTAFAIDADEKRVLTGDAAGGIDLWNVGTTGRALHWDRIVSDVSNFGGHEVHGLAFRQDSDGFVSADGDGQVATWDFTTTTPIMHKQIGDYVSATSLTVPKDLDVAIVGTSTGRMYGFNLSDLKAAGDFQVFEARQENVVTSVLYSEKSQNIVVLSDKGRVAVYRNLGMSSTEFGSTADTAAAIHLADGQTAITGSRDGVIRQWSLAKVATQLLQIGGRGLDAASQGPDPRQIMLSEDGSQALITYYDTNAKLWRREPTPGTVEVDAHAMSPDGQFLVREKKMQADGDRFVPSTNEIVRLADNKVVHTLTEDQTLVGFIRGEKVLVEAPNGELSLWKFAATSPEWTTGEPEERGYGGVYDVSPDGTRVLTVFDGKITVWKIGQPKPETSLKVDSPVTAAHFLPDNTRFALGFVSGALEIWSVGSERALESFDGHGTEVRRIASNADGSMIVSAAIDGGTSLWRSTQQEQLQAFDVQGPIYSIAFDPSGEKILIATSDGISEWQIEPVALADAETQVRLACEKLEQLNVSGFDSRDVLKVPVLRGLPNNPCVAMGITQPKAKPVMAKPVGPAGSTGAGAAPD